MPFYSILSNLKTKAEHLISIKSKIKPEEYYLKMEELLKEIALMNLLKEETQQFEIIIREAQNIGNIGSWVIDIEEIKHYWSDETYRIFGYKLNEIMPSIDLVRKHMVPEDLKDFDEIREEWIVNNKVINIEYEFRIIDKQSDLKYCKIYAKVIRNNEGLATRIVGIVQDVTDYREIEKQLEESRSRYKNLVGNLPEAVVVHSEGIIKYANNSAIKILGAKDKNEIIGKNVWDFVDKRYHEIVMKRVKSIVEEGKNAEVLEEKFIKLNGDKIDVEVFGISIMYQGKPASQVVFKDISDQKKTSVALQQAADLVKNIQTGIHIYKLEKLDDDRTLRMITANPASERLTGVKAKDVIGKTLDENFPDLRKKGIPQQYANVVRTQMPIEIEDLYYSDDRVIAGAFTVRAFPLPDNQVGVSFDNSTEKVKALANLKSSEELYRSLLATSPDSICMTDLDGKIVFASENMARIHGYESYKDLIGMNGFDLVHKEDTSKAKEGVGLTLKYGFTKNIEYRLVRKDGGAFIGEVNVALIRHSNGHPKAFIINTRDITIRKLSENQIIKAKERAEQADRLKSAFLANMSHEIRTPINGIVGFTALLRNDKIDKQKKENYINIIHKSSNQLLAIINDIVDISKIEADLIDISWNTCNINELVEDICSNFENERKILSIYNLKIITKKNLPDKEAEILTDEVRLRQILNNLVSNALKFTAEGQIIIGYKLTGDDFIEFYVEDTGIGISKENQKIIFDRFRQEDDSNTRKFGGTGLGLAICRGLTSLLGGDIFVHSEKGKGSRFYFTHPYKLSVDEDQVVKEVRIPSDEIFIWKNKNILVVDDTEEILTYFEELFSETEANLVKARTAKETFDILKKNKNIHIILLDIQLPDMNGYEVAKIILNEYQKIPIISQTAYALTGDKEKAFEVGCVGYIAKPIKQDQLFNLIDKFIL